MQNFHRIIQRAMVSVFVIFFALVSTYVPQTWNKVEYAEAGALGGGSTEWTQIANNIELAFVAGKTALSAAFNAITSSATFNLFTKEYILDGLAWVLAKQIVAQMTSSIISWIQSGFKGSPAFVQDMKKFLTDVADQAIGDYLQELDGPLSFLCSPFKLDVRVALQLSYARERESQPVASSCTLTGALANLENFVDGDFTQGGWENWFSVTGKPEVYTPYGSYLTAQAQSKINILNDKKNEADVLGFGGGFLSFKNCTSVSTSGGSKQDCNIVTPGKVTQETLNFHLSSGSRSLIQADEFNEILAALFTQLSKEVISGASGLMGSGGAGVGAVIDSTKLGTLINEGLAAELKYRNGVLNAQASLTAYTLDVTIDSRKRAAAQAELDKLPSLLNKITTNISTLTSLQTLYLALPASPSEGQLQPIVQGYSSITVHNNSEVDAAINNWASLVK
jgi:hypothetical protein